MLNRLKAFFLGVEKQQDAVSILLSEVSFLRSQVESLQTLVTQLTKRPEPKVTNPDDMRPKKYDAVSKRYVPKTDEEINSDMQGMRELGIL